MARVLESPTLGKRMVSGRKVGGRDWIGGTNLARLEMSLNPSTTSEPAAAPPLTPKDKTPP